MAFTSAGAFSRKYAIKDLRSFLTILMLALLAAEGVGEQAKTPRCGIFASRYPTKQGARQAAPVAAQTGDYVFGRAMKNSTPASHIK